MGTFYVRHETVYRYRTPVAFGEHRLMLRPRDGIDQRVRDFAISVDPGPVSLRWAEDPSGNMVGLAAFGRRGTELRVIATATVDHVPFRAADLHIAPHAERPPFSYGAEEAADLARFIERQYPDPGHAVDRWARDLLTVDPDRETWAYLCRMTAAIRRDFAYLRREEAGIQSPVRTLATGRGSCRDFAVLMIEAVRTQGLAARFVSGYLNTGSGDERVRRAGGYTHAWLQVYLPGGGWIDFDPTSGAVGNGDLIRVALVRDPAQASPISGTFMGFPHDFVAMTVDVEVGTVAPGTSAAAAAA